MYFFDGTVNGFLTAFVQAFLDTNALLSSRVSQLPLGQEPITVTTDEKLAARAEQRLCAFDRNAKKDLSALLRSGEEDAEQAAFAYFKLLATKKRPVSRMFSEEAVFRATEILKRIGLEIHRFHGFIRFTECASGALYAPFSPDNDICDLLLPHFKARFPNYPFVLHDVKRKKAAVYDGQNVFVAPLDKADILLSADEENWQTLWKQYYTSVNIPSRERLKQMRGYMPARYWQFMPEKN